MVKSLSTPIKWEIIYHKRNGASNSKIFKILNVSKKIIKKYWIRYSQTKNVKEIHRPGRPATLSKRDKQNIVRDSERNRRKSSRKIAQDFVNTTNQEISASYVRKILFSSGLKARRPAKKPLLKKDHILQRMEFAKSVKLWGIIEWSNVIFSDESKFCLDGSDGQKFVRRRSGEKYRPDLVDGRLKFGRGSIMVWAFITNFGDRGICLVEGHMDSEDYLNILQTYIRYPAHTVIFQDDNDPKHRAGKVIDWKVNQGMDCLVWPPNSPDINIIENIWDAIDRNLYSGIKGQGYYNKETLWRAVQEEFYNLSNECISNLYENLPSRVQAVLNAKGSYTKY